MTHIFKLGLLFGATSLLVACGGKDKPAETPTPEASSVEAPVKVTKIDEHTEGSDHHDDDDHGDDHASDEHGSHGPHSHGAADLSIVVVGDLLTVTLDTPLANLGMPETKGEIIPPDTLGRMRETSSIISFNEEAGCTGAVPTFKMRYDGDHGSGDVNQEFGCKSLRDLTSATVNLFDTFEGFDKIDTVLIDGKVMVADTLTADQPKIKFDR